MTTRVAIIGNSHMGAYAAARATLSARFPDMRLSFFAFPDHRLTSATLDAQGVLRAEARKGSALPDHIDLAAQDHILLVGQPLGLTRLARLLSSVDVLGWIGLGLERSVSPTLLAEYTDAWVQKPLRTITRYFNDDPRLIVVPQPMVAPRAEIVEGRLSALAHHPEAPRALALWREKLRAAAHDMQARVFFQPESLLTDPAHTHAHFARATRLTDDQPAGPSDYTHMNEDYAVAHFTALTGAMFATAPTPETQEELS